MLIIVLPSAVLFGIFISLSLFVYILKNPEKLDKWIYLYNRYSIHKTEKKERKIISSNLDYKISTMAKQVNKEAEGIIPFGLRIKWADLNADSYVEKNEVIVVLKREDNNDQNIINACGAFIPKALLPKSRNIIDATILKTLDTYFIKKVLNQGNYDSAYNYFMENIFNPFCSESEENNKLVQIYSGLDEIGFLTRVLLEEFRRVGAKLYGTMEEGSFIEESKAFLKFIKSFTERRPGDLTKLYFDGDRIKIAIIFIAKMSTIRHEGVVSYVSRMRRHVQEYNVQRVFVFSYSQRYDEFVEDSEGYIVGIKKGNEFVNINSFEDLCKQEKYVRQTRKQVYYSKDANGKVRKSKYLLYEAV